MNQISVSQAPPLIQLVARWVHMKHHDMQRAWSQEGGWEGWMQVELAMFLQSQLQAQRVRIRREQNCYKTDKLRADLTMDGWNLPHQGPPNHMIELKCESQHQDFKPGAFAVRFVSDLEKISKESIKREWRNRRLWIIGVSGNSKVADAMDKQLKDRKIRAHEVVVSPPPGGPMLWGEASIWFWHTDIL